MDKFDTVLERGQIAHEDSSMKIIMFKLINHYGGIQR